MSEGRIEVQASVVVDKAQVARAGSDAAKAFSGSLDATIEKLGMTGRINIPATRAALSKGTFAGAAMDDVTLSKLLSANPQLAVFGRGGGKVSRSQLIAQEYALGIRKPPPILGAGGGMGLGGLRSGLSALSASGVPYIGTLARAMFNPVSAVAAALALSFVALKKVVDEYGNAAKLYAKGLQSGGLPMGFLAHRQSLAQVIGVGEAEVFRYGKAVRYLNDQLAWSTSVFASTNRELTATNWGFGVLGKNFHALMSVIAEDIAPHVRMLTSAFSDLFETIGRFLQSGMGKAILDHFWEPLKIAAVLSKSAVGTSKIGGAAPELSSSFRRLQTSSWERMGLVLGMGGQNYAQQTAQNTRQAVALLGQIAQAVTLDSTNLFRKTGDTDFMNVPSTP